MPNTYSGTKEVLKYIAEEISPNTFINIMAQYYPAGKIYEINELADTLDMSDYREALKTAENLGLYNLL